MRRCRIFWLVSWLILVAFIVDARAQAKYPNRAIEMVVPYGAGGGADLSTRIFSEELARILKVPINVVNRGGGGGALGATYVMNSPKDGYTLLAGSWTPLVTIPPFSKKIIYDPLKDFIPLAHFASVSTGFIVRSDSPFQTLKQLIEYARENPGKLKNASGGGLLTDAYINLEILCSKANIKISTIPFEGGGESLAALLGGHMDLSSGTITTHTPHIKAGKSRCLAISSKTRHPDLPDVPTTAELGYPDVNLRIYNGVYAASGVPPEVLNVLTPALEKVLKDPELVQRALKAGFAPEYMNSEEFRRVIEAGLQAVTKVVKDAGLVK